MENKNSFKPYIPADKVLPEITVTSIIIGVLLAVIFGAANAYLGLRVGMTVSASIPAAVISMGVIRILLKRNSILENNLVQTIGSAGESLAAGTVFTLPALFMWANENPEKVDSPDMLEITLIALIGGLLGVLFMVPLRNALIVKEHGTLPYPEGTACAEVLLAGEKGGSSASTVFAGMGFAALFKFVIDGLKLAKEEISLPIKALKGEIGTQIYPAVMSVGYICGPKISSYMFSGGVLSWLVLIPLIAFFGDSTIAASSAGDIWDKYIRYIGAGALTAGGIISLIKSLPLIIKTFTGAIKSLRGSAVSSNSRTDKDINMVFILAAIVILTLAIWLIPAIPVSLLGAAIIVVFGFFFATVSSRMVGLVGSSNNPVSGMTIATLLIATFILKITGMDGFNGMCSAIAIGSIICIVSAIAGDTSQDLKTGYILGSTPKKQQIGEMLGVVAAALTIGGTLYLLSSSWAFGGKTLPAPQASIMKLIVEGVMEGNLPWALVLIGAFIAIVVELIGIPVLPFAIGVYLPIHLNACIMIGGLVRLAVEKITAKKDNKEETVNNGILFCSGMIAGEGIIGILLAVLTILKLSDAIDLSAKFNLSSVFTTVSGILLLAITVMTLLLFTLKKSKKSNEE